MSGVFLRDRALGRIVAGHPWVYESDIQRVDQAPPDGNEIVVRTTAAGFVGVGFYNSRSKIPVRILSRNKSETLDEAFFRSRLKAAQALRERAFAFAAMPGLRPGVLPPAYRLVWSEADFLPGLVVDRYADAWVIQTLTLAMDQRKCMIAGLLRDLFGAQVIIERNDVASRKFEGLEPHKGFLAGSGEAKRPIQFGKAKFEVDLIEGQKTGEYLDQVGNQLLVGSLASKRRVLDCCTYHGGFAMQAALGGATSVEALDISEDAIAVCRRNAELSGVAAVTWKVGNVFDELHDRVKGREEFDLVILDPPSFTRSRAKLDDALRGYKEINLRALMLLPPGGLLATFCCSHHVDAMTFRDVVLDAAFDARRILRLRHTFVQPLDHPVIPAIPETEYLKGFLFEVV